MIKRKHISIKNALSKLIFEDEKRWIRHFHSILWTNRTIIKRFIDVTSISFVLRSGGGAALVGAIESSRYRELASPRARVIEASHREVMRLSRSDEALAKWWEGFEVMTACFVINKALQAAHLEHFEPLAFWILNILSFLILFLFFSFLFSL